jgi:hypothetical protein
MKTLSVIRNLLYKKIPSDLFKKSLVGYPEEKGVALKRAPVIIVASWFLNSGFLLKKKINENTEQNPHSSQQKDSFTPIKNPTEWICKGV